MLWRALTSGRVGLMGGRLALQLLVALAVIAAALLDPFHAAIAVVGLVGVVLIDAGMHAALAGGFLGIFRIYRRRKHCGACRSGRGRRGRALRGSSVWCVLL